MSSQELNLLLEWRKTVIIKNCTVGEKSDFNLYFKSDAERKYISLIVII